MSLITTDLVGDDLRQGDILRQVVLYSTKVDEGADENEGYGIVLSRNCRALREPDITIAAIAKFGGDGFAKAVGGAFDGSTSLRTIRQRFDQIRDGYHQPDRFYLGTLPGESTATRFCVRLDLIHTVRICEVRLDESWDAEKQQNWWGKRKTWISKHRVGRLSHEHRRQLHVRLFTAFAAEGYDDFRWWCDSDLATIITIGNTKVRALEDQEAQVVMKLQVATQQLGNDKKRGGLRRELEKVRQQLDQERNAILPYTSTWKERHPETEPQEFLGQA